MDDPNNHRLIIDCLLNIPLLYWATEVTGDGKYREVAEKHIHTTMKHIIREDGSTWHTVFFDSNTGGFVRGATVRATATALLGRAARRGGFTVRLSPIKTQGELNISTILNVLLNIS